MDQEWGSGEQASNEKVLQCSELNLDPARHVEHWLLKIHLRITELGSEKKMETALEIRGFASEPTYMK